MKRNRKLTINALLVLAALLASSAGYCANNKQPVQSKSGGAYLLGPEDVLDISIWNEEKLKQQVLIRPDGRFSFPLAGEINALGMSPEDVRKEIAKKISKYIPDPVVTVVVTKVAGYKIYVIGQVKKSGQYIVGRRIDILQALAMAGGLTPFASEDNIKVLRKKNGKQYVISFEYGEIKNGRNLKKNITLDSGDVILVP